MSNIKIIFVGAFLCLLVVPNIRAQEEHDWDWVNKHYNRVLDEVLPLERERGYAVSFRTHREVYTDTLEYSCSFAKDYQGNPIEVVIKMADTVSLYDQLMALHRKSPTESIESITKRLKSKEWRLTDKSCPVIKDLFERYKKIAIPLPLYNPEITLHPVIHTFWISGSMSTIKLVSYDEEHPLVVWAKEARRALEPCAINKNY